MLESLEIATVASSMKPVPVRVACMPPVAIPEFGWIAATLRVGVGVRVGVRVGDRVGVRVGDGVEVGVGVGVIVGVGVGVA